MNDLDDCHVCGEPLGLDADALPAVRFMPCTTCARTASTVVETAITDEEIRGIYRTRRDRETLDMLMWAIRSQDVDFRRSGRAWFIKLRDAT